jgi:hypothetical protein
LFDSSHRRCEVSVVIPCLHEAETLLGCEVSFPSCFLSVIHLGETESRTRADRLHNEG